MDEIITMIEQAKIDHYTATGIKPTFVYLGKQEIRMLQAWGYRAGLMSVVTPKITGDVRAEVSGVKVFVVDADKHLMCA